MIRSVFYRQETTDKAIDHVFAPFLNAEHMIYSQLFNRRFDCMDLRTKNKSFLGVKRTRWARSGENLVALKFWGEQPSQGPIVQWMQDYAKLVLVNFSNLTHIVHIVDSSLLYIMVPSNRYCITRILLVFFNYTVQGGSQKLSDFKL